MQGSRLCAPARSSEGEERYENSNTGGSGDVSWQLNALMPGRRLYVFSDRTDEKLLERMPYRENVVVKSGRFPESAAGTEDEKYALVHMDTGLYETTFSGLQYFIPRMERGGAIVAAGYENGKNIEVCRAFDDFESEYGALLLAPLGDIEGTVMVMLP